MSEGLEQAQELVIQDLETLKVMSDPLRMQILELVLHDALTTKQIARAAELPASRLYYHINLLEKHGLLRVASTRLVSGIVEKYYRTVAQFITVDPDLFRSLTPEASEAFDAALAGFFDNAKADAVRSLQAGLFGLKPTDTEGTERGPVGHLTRSVAYLTREQAEAIRQQLKAVMKDFDGFDGAGEPGTQRYAIILGLFPTLDPLQPDPEEADDA
jgi:DNA-binding transcriptional ArsR family regulator